MTRHPSPSCTLLCSALLLCTATPASADYLGTVQALVHEFSYCDGPPEIQPLAYIEVEIVGLGTVVTDSVGTWSIPGSGGSRDVNCVLRGPFCWVDENLEGPLASWSGVAEEDVPLTILFDNSNSRQDERNAFDAVNDIHEFMSHVAPPGGLINAQMLVQVGRNNPCNAEYLGRLALSREGAGCANSGELEQVVAWTYGFGLNEAIQGGWNQGLPQGNADVLANLMTLDSKIGRGLILGDCVDGLRDSDNDLTYPDDVIGQQDHIAGSVIAGFHWDILTGLQELYGIEAGRELAAYLWHRSRLTLQPYDQPDQVLFTFEVDDDDGDLSNGTPHYDIICAAAEHHGFDCPELVSTSASTEADIAEFVELDPNVPNPFNPTTSITFALPSNEAVYLRVFDMSGRLVRVLVDGEMYDQGRHEAVWNGRDDSGMRAASGTYFYRLESGEFVETKKMILLK